MNEEQLSTFVLLTVFGFFLIMMVYDLIINYRMNKLLRELAERTAKLEQRLNTHEGIPIE